ncbi:SRPBCC family protein [Flagellimonas sp.]|uniref:SRPBCC family protein n=1 Tax=Flagellimonas sp. TaxID=2058762 RepID=UPI003C7DE45F
MSKQNFDVQSIAINADPKKVFEFVAEPANVPKWAIGFSDVKDNTAYMQTPNGKMQVGLKMSSNRALGTVDTVMEMPDGSIGKAYSRVIPNDEGQSTIFSFVLMAPPVPLELLEGTLEEQRKQLAEELQLLKKILESNI